jgi:hypothetical protein
MNLGISSELLPFRAVHHVTVQISYLLRGGAPVGPQPRHRSWRPEHRAIIVGIEIDSWTVHHVWVQNDGGLRSDGRVHCPPDGRTVPGEALVTFGLTSFRIFPATDVEEAAIYAAELEVQLECFRASLDVP